MADKTPFLSGWFGKLASDPKLINEMRLNNMIGQYKKANPGKTIVDFAKSNSGVINPDTMQLDEAATTEFFKNNPTYTDLNAEGLQTLAADPWHSGNAGKLLKGYASAHPWKTAAGVGLGLTNLSGLTDNDYYGGQLAGLAAGGLGSAFLGSGFSPMVTMAGGALGSLFDKLRQKQAESKRASQYNNY